ncbi:MAG: hypothetical protein ACLQGP_10725 [Isosphaeraceae bacterium]
MSDKSRDPSRSKKDVEKKQLKPVELTDDQLLAITGGAGVNNPPPQNPNPN